MARPYHASAVASIDEQVLDAFRRRGLSGVTVEPHQRDLDLENERDLRLEGDTFLRLVVSTARVRELTDGGVDFAFDCIGHAATTAQALAMARPGDWTVTRGGLAVLVGWPTGEATIDALDLVIGEKQLAGSAGGSSRPERDFPLFLQWYRDGQLDLDALVTERWSLDQIVEATDRLAAGRVSGRSVIVFE